MLIVCLLILMTLSASNVQAQACGEAYARFVVSDSAGNSISDVTIEIVAKLRYEDYEELREKYGYKEAGYQSFPFKLPAQVTDEVLKLSIPLDIHQDRCGNPLKQRANVTEVITLEEFKRGSKADKKNFGLCKWENGAGEFLLKISAPGYITDYYIGNYLGGCGGAWTFTLTGKK